MENAFDYDVAVVGAGPAGIGTAVALDHLELEYAVLERDCIGSSFRQWPAEMRLLTPSFPANAFGARDLNAITPDTSPALALDREHPTGDQYADYLEAVAEFHELPVRTDVDVEAVSPDPEPSVVGPDAGTDTDDAGFALETDDDRITARYVVWAAGQFQYPSDGSIPGSSHAVHISSVDSWARHADLVASDLEDRRGDDESDQHRTLRHAADGGGAVATTAAEPSSADELPSQDEVVVVGGAESGIDAALALADVGFSVTVLDDDGTWQFRSPDPSEVLSPRTNERLEAALRDGKPIDLVAGARVERIERETAADENRDRDENGDGDENRGPASESFVVQTTDGNCIRSRTPPILATGFEGSLGLVDEQFAVDGDTPDLTDRDESTATPGLFLAGPQVAHNGQQFCFIYKFRRRFAVVAETIGDRLGVDTDPLERYRETNMYLEDLECCEPEYCDC